MEKQEAENKIKEIAQKIAEEYQPEKIILFGSYAWGNPGLNSDIDLFIVKNGEKSRLEMMKEVEKIIPRRNSPIDMLVYKDEQVKKRIKMKDPFFLKIFNSGKIIYESKR